MGCLSRVLFLSLPIGLIPRNCIKSPIKGTFDLSCMRRCKLCFCHDMVLWSKVKSWDTQNYHQNKLTSALKIGLPACCEGEIPLSQLNGPHPIYAHLCLACRSLFLWSWEIIRAEFVLATAIMWHWWNEKRRLHWHLTMQQDDNF